MTIFCILFLLFSLDVCAKDICIVGYVMDKFCIDRGTLLDNPSVNTLEGPDKHTVHCLVDVGQCYQSGFEVLIDPEVSGESIYCRAYELDDNGNDMIIEFAREIGSCSTCSSSGTLNAGFRATILGTLSGERTLQVSQVLSDSEGCPDGMVLPETGLNCESGSQQTAIILHGFCMVISWGFLLPVGVLSARFLKHRPDGFWFKIHRPMQIGGIVIAIIGMIIALTTFDVFIDLNLSFIHGVIGLVTMALGVFQPINAYFRPHVPKAGEPRETKRFIWEILHKTSGYIAIFLGLVNVGIGTTRPAKPENETLFQVLFGIAIGLILIILISYIRDGRNYKQQVEIKSVNQKRGPRTDTCVSDLKL